jgi:DnaJ-class molecular chaperone
MSANSTLKNYYAILGVPESASLFEIESAYEKLAAKWHPDKHK